MGNRFDPGDRRSDDMVEAVDRAAHSISHTLAEGFKLIALQIAHSASGVDNSPAIEASVKKLKAFTDSLRNSLPPA
jgi:hypothetical protein